MSLRQAKLGPFLLNRHNHMGWQQIITFTTIEYRKDTLTKNSFLVGLSLNSQFSLFLLVGRRH